MSAAECRFKLSQFANGAACKTANRSPGHRAVCCRPYVESESLKSKLSSPDSSGGLEAHWKACSAQFNSTISICWFVNWKITRNYSSIQMMKNSADSFSGKPELASRRTVVLVWWAHFRVQCIEYICKTDFEQIVCISRNCCRTQRDGP